MPKLTTFLLLPGRARAAAKFYASVFGRDFKSHGFDGMGASFRLRGQEFVLLDVGPKPKFTLAVSFYVECRTQAEVDRFWKKLLAGGGKPSRCGWLQDRYGVAWQVIPKGLPKLLFGDGRDPEASQRGIAAMMKMRKLDIAAIRRARAGT